MDFARQAAVAVRMALGQANQHNDMTYLDHRRAFGLPATLNDLSTRVEVHDFLDAALGRWRSCGPGK